VWCAPNGGAEADYTGSGRSIAGWVAPSDSKGRVVPSPAERDSVSTDQFHVKRILRVEGSCRLSSSGFRPRCRDYSLQNGPGSTISASSKPGSRRQPGPTIEGYSVSAEGTLGCCSNPTEATRHVVPDRLGPTRSLGRGDAGLTWSPRAFVVCTKRSCGGHLPGAGNKLPCSCSSWMMDWRHSLETVPCDGRLVTDGREDRDELAPGAANGMGERYRPANDAGGSDAASHVTPLKVTPAHPEPRPGEP
jgi:hypothetical protein